MLVVLAATVWRELRSICECDKQLPQWREITHWILCQTGLSLIMINNALWTIIITIMITMYASAAFVNIFSWYLTEDIFFIESCWHTHLVLHVMNDISSTIYTTFESYHNFVTAWRTAAKFCPQIRVIHGTWARWDVAEVSCLSENFTFSKILQPHLLFL